MLFDIHWWTYKIHMAAIMGKPTRKEHEKDMYVYVSENGGALC
jgi:hypothetical protein